MAVMRLRPEVERVEPDRYYTDRQLAGRWGIHPITVWKWARRGVIPKPTKLGPNCSRWQGRAILDHEAALADER